MGDEHLSNTATPIYYGRFKEKVLRGEIEVCYEIALEMNRIDALIEDPEVYYDPYAINGFIAFCERELTRTDGEPLHLLDSFKLWAEQIFGWYYFVNKPVWDDEHHQFITKNVKKRLTTRQYLIVARGAAKSMYAACLQAYFLTIDTETTTQITTAPTMKQAEEVMSPIRTAITRAPGPLFKFLTEGSLQNTTGSRIDRQKLASTKKGIENFLTGSTLEIRPMSINKLQGARPKVATIDEWLSGDIREDVVGALTQGASKLPDYLVVAISSEGTVRNGPGDTIKMELADILKGEYNRPDTSIWHYKLDDKEEVKNPAKWHKANPNIGIIVTYEEYALDVERADNAPAAANDILAKRFGIPVEGTSYFFTYDQCQVHDRKFDYRGLPCSMGADLSQGDDFCAFTFLFPLETGGFGVKTRSYITEMTYRQLPSAMRLKYDEFLAEGTLQIFDTTILDMIEVFEDLDAYIDSMEYDVRSFGYDPYNAKEFVARWEQINGPYGIEKVPQGVRTESVPLGEIRKLAEDRILFFDELLMSFTMGHCTISEDTNGNRKLLKRRYDEKIDNVAAMMDALVAYKNHKEAFE